MRTLVEEKRDAGRYQSAWDGKDNTGKTVASGVYFYRFTAGTFTETRKMITLK